MTNSPDQPLWEAEGVARFVAGPAGLPECELLARPALHYPPGTPAPEGMAETDPWFILGNYGLTVFPHASGSYQLLHTERGFARLNHDGSDQVTGRACRSGVTVGGRQVDLLRTASQRCRFGCGRAAWEYRIDNVAVTRRMDVVPSRDTQDRIAGFRLTLTFRNGGADGVQLQWSEGLAARYHFANWNNPPARVRPARHPVSAGCDDRSCRAVIQPEALRPLVFDEPGRAATADGQAINVHMQVAAGDARCRVEQIDEEACWLLAEGELALAAGGEAQVVLFIGWSDRSLDWSRTSRRLGGEGGDIQRLWSERLPAFAEAPEPLRSELRWHVHTLHAMATWDARYQSVFIPQGTLYEYGLGVSAVTRDHAMHALPACTYDADLALSVVEYLARHTDVRGHMQHGDEGAGIVPVGADQKSDSQLFALLLTCEYLRCSDDVACLSRPQAFFPYGTGGSGTLLDRIGRWVRFLRDGIGVGSHGLVRIMCSDLSDTLHSSFPHLSYSHSSYGKVFNGESYVNTTLALHVLRTLGDWLEARGGSFGAQEALAQEIRDACRDYKGELREALLRDMQGRRWVPRGRVGQDVLGEEDAFAAPQAFIFNNPDIPRQRREEIWAAVKPGLWNDEPFGVRLRQGQGRHRCGMVWYAWTGMFAWGLAAIDPEATREAIERLSLRRRARIEPDQWVGLWSHSDVTWSYNGAGGGIPGTTRVGYVKRFPHFCAHVHAWPVALWQRLAQVEAP